MRVAFRVIAVGGTLILLFLLQLSYKRVHTPSVLPEPETSTESDDGWPVPEDKLVVVPKMPGEDTDWLSTDLPDWQHAIYHMDNPNAEPHVPTNKGREGMAYLTYLVDHYSHLPSTIAFIHSHRDGYPKAWHTDSDDYSNVNSLRDLRIDYVQGEGYVNLRCLAIPGCPDEIQPFREPYEEHRSAEHEFSGAWRYMFGNETEIPQRIGAACCSQFAVSRKQVLKRSQDDYKRYRDWLLETELSDDVSGRIMEYIFHIIFGREAVFCPELEYCYCHTFGRCGQT